MQEIIWSAIVSLVITSMIFYALSRTINWLGRRKVFFVLVPENRILAVERGGEIIYYLANIKKFDRDIDRKTGKVKEITGREKERCESFLLNSFGVRCIAFDRVKKYHQPAMEYTNENGECEEILLNEADSLFYVQSFPVAVKGVHTKENTPITVRLRINLETIDASKPQGYENWQYVITDRIKTKIRDFVNRYTLQQLLALQADIVKEIVNLSCSDTDGTTGLMNCVGQKIAGAFVISIDVENPAIRQPQYLEEKADAKVKMDGKVSGREQQAKTNPEGGATEVPILQAEPGELSGIEKDGQKISPRTGEREYLGEEGLKILMGNLFSTKQDGGSPQ